MRCGDTRHRSQDCFHKKSVRNFCKKIGHLERVCITKTTRKQRGGEHRSNFVDETEATMERSTTPSSERNTASQEYALYYNRSTLPNEPLTVDVNISQASVKMEIDTGATITPVSDHSYNELWNEQNRPCLRPADVIVRTYTGEQVDVVGIGTVLVKHMQQEVLLPLHIVKRNGPTLLGRDWFKKLKIN